MSQEYIDDDSQKIVMTKSIYITLYKDEYDGSILAFL